MIIIMIIIIITIIKEFKYRNIFEHYAFVPIAMESLGLLCYQSYILFIRIKLSLQYLA